MKGWTKNSKEFTDILRRSRIELPSGGFDSDGHPIGEWVVFEYNETTKKIELVED